jgi:hypothetical protein
VATRTTRTANGQGAVGPDPTNDAEATLLLSAPYLIDMVIEGDSDMIFHRWSVEGIQSKADAPKGSAAKKTDDLESYVWRDDKRRICVPGEYLRMACVNAGAYRQDPRSPRKSMKDLLKAAIVPLTPLAPITPAGQKGPTTKWEYEDRRRVMVQRNGVTRARPAFFQGWQASFRFMVNLPEYVPQAVFRDIVSQAGKLSGLADSRPTYGRFSIVSWKEVSG